MSERMRAALCLLGIVLLTAAWVVAGLVTTGFDPMRQSISQLQRDGAATGVVMTAAFAVFAGGAVAFAPVLPRLPRTALLVAGVATLGAALAPLGEVRGGRQDAVHLAFGATGYAALSVLPLLAAVHLSGARRWLAVASGAVASACLLGTVPADSISGALQRAGFLSAHLWLAAVAVQVLVGGRRPVVVELSEPDPAWPQRFCAHRQRIASALGAPSTDVQHVGSTAVPGLAAKPVVDVQLAVDDLDVAVTDLEAAGYVLRVREPGHRMMKTPPPDEANVHLHEPGDPALEERLRLRDRLRADPVARQRYEDVKRSLAGRSWPDVNHYAEAKGPVIRAILAETGRP